jgi:hypothetical protein
MRVEILGLKIRSHTLLLPTSLMLALPLEGIWMIALMIRKFYLFDHYFSKQTPSLSP